MTARRVGKYACQELERRFLLRELPEGVNRDSFRRITDRYLPGTCLRLRCTESPTGECLDRKLAQKVAAGALETKITNLYLSDVRDAGSPAAAAVGDSRGDRGSVLHRRWAGVRERRGVATQAARVMIRPCPHGGEAAAAGPPC